MNAPKILQSSARILLPLAAALLTSPAIAQLQWDTNTGSTGAQDGGGTWNTTTNNWYNNTSGLNQTWTNDGTVSAWFGAGGATGGKTVTVEGDLKAGGLSFFSNPSYTLSGTGTIELADAALISLDSASTASSQVVINTALKGGSVSVFNTSPSGEQFITFGGANTWNGTLSLGGFGTGSLFVRAANSGALNSLTSIEVNSGATLSLVGTGSTYTPAITITGPGNDGNRGALRMDQSMTLTGRITLAGDATISTQDSSGNPSTVTMTSGIGEIGGNYNLTKSGTGNLIVAGASNYTGTTTIGPNGNTSNAGTLTLDFSNAAAPVSNLLYNGVTANSLRMVGTTSLTNLTNGTARLQVTGKDETMNSQSFSGVEVTGFTTITATSGANGSVNLNLGTISRSGSGSYLALTGPTAGAITSTNTGLIGSWASYAGSERTGWAGVSGGNVTAFTGDLAYVTGTSVSVLPGYSATANLGISGASTGNVLQTAGVTQLNSITMADAAAARTITVGAGNTLSLGADGGIQITSDAQQLTVGSAPGIGTLTAGTEAGTELFLSNWSPEHALRINSVVANNAGGAVNLMLNGSGLVQLAGANTYSGTTTVLSGTLEARSNTALGDTSAATFVGNGAALQLAGNVSDIAENLTLAGSGIFNGGALRNASGSNRLTGTLSLIGGSRINSDAGKLTLSKGDAATNVITGSQSLTFGGAGTIEIASRIATGGGTITKDGSGTLILSGANTYTGSTTVTGGVLRIAHANALGASSSGTTISGGSLELAGNITITGEALTLSASNNSGIFRNVSGSNTYAGAITLNAHTRFQADAGSQLTLDVTSGNAIATSNSGSTRSLAFGGSGDIIIKDAITHSGSGALNLYKDGQGTTTLMGSVSLAGTTSQSLQVNSGTLTLDHSLNASILPTSQVITLGGGTLEVKGGAASSTPQIGDILLQQNGGYSKFAVGANTTLTTGIWTRPGGHLLLIDLSAQGSVLKASPGQVGGSGIDKNMVIATSNNASFIVRDANNRHDFAAVNTVGGEATIGRLEATTALPDGSAAMGGSLTTPYLLTGNSSPLTLEGNVASSTVRVDTTGDAAILDLNGNELRLQRLGLLVDGNNDFTIRGEGEVRGGITNAVFLYNYGTGTLNIESKLEAGSGQVFLAGSGLIDWKSAANATGNNWVLGTTVRLSHVDTITLSGTQGVPGAGGLLIGGGGIVELAAGDLTREISGISGGRVTLLSDGGFSAFGADRIVDLTTPAGGKTLVWGSTSGFLGNGRKLILGSPYADATVDFKNNLDLNGGNQTVEVQSANTPGVGGLISGNIEGGSGSLTKTGPGILTLAGANTYTGTTAVMDGTLNVSGSISGNSLVSVADGATLGVSGTGSINAEAFSFFDGSGLSLEIGNTTATTLAASDAFSLEGEIKLSLQLTAAPLDGTLFTLLDGSGALMGYNQGARFFANSVALNEGDIFLVSTGSFSQSFQISYMAGGGADVALLAVPEPTTGAALISSVGLLLGLNRFRRRSARRVLGA